MNTQERFDPDELRTASGRFATGVAIVVSTRAADGRPVPDRRRGGAHRPGRHALSMIGGSGAGLEEEQV